MPAFCKQLTATNGIKHRQLYVRLKEYLRKKTVYCRSGNCIWKNRGQRTIFCVRIQKNERILRALRLKSKIKFLLQCLTLYSSNTAVQDAARTTRRYLITEEMAVCIEIRPGEPSERKTPQSINQLVQTAKKCHKSFCPSDEERSSRADPTALDLRGKDVARIP